MSSGRGDLGFIANSNSNRLANKNFVGSSGHSSKKGVMSISQVSQLQNKESTSLGSTNDSMIAKRTDWLETQERKISATIHETKSETNKLNDEIMYLQKSMQSQKNVSEQLFNEMQSVYGFVPSKILKVLPSGMSFEKYVANGISILEESALQEKWILLLYPMKEICVADEHTRSFMRWKRVDKETGQLSIEWAMIFEKMGDDETRPIQKFSLTASSAEDDA